MAIQQMFGVINNSPVTKLMTWIPATAQTIEVEEIGRLPPAPNVATIGIEANAELVFYNGIDGNSLTGCIRGFNGTLAQVWQQGESVYRAYTSVDHERFISNIEELGEMATQLQANKLAISGDGSNVTSDFTQADVRTNIVSGNTLSSIFGFISKWLADLKDGAFAMFGVENGQIARGDHTHSASAVGAVGLVGGVADPLQTTHPFVTVTASRTIALSDLGKFLLVNTTSAVTLTLPNTLLHPGFEFNVRREGTGTVTIAVQSGVTFNGLTTTTIADRYKSIGFKQSTATLWCLIG